MVVQPVLQSLKFCDPAYGRAGLKTGMQRLSIDSFIAIDLASHCERSMRVQSLDLLFYDDVPRSIMGVLGHVGRGQDGDDPVAFSSQIVSRFEGRPIRDNREFHRY